jgi:hypothetical protein
MIESEEWIRVTTKNYRRSRMCQDLRVQKCRSREIFVQKRDDDELINVDESGQQKWEVIISLRQKEDSLWLSRKNVIQLGPPQLKVVISDCLHFHRLIKRTRDLNFNRNHAANYF